MKIANVCVYCIISIIVAIVLVTFFFRKAPLEPIEYVPLAFLGGFSILIFWINYLLVKMEK